MWWENQDKELKTKVKELVKKGRLDLVSGGWSAPDEAVTTYDDILDNFMIGQTFLQKEFGIHPKVSWQLDAFGVSTAYARLARDVGFDGMFFSRVDISEKKEMRKKHVTQQIWRPHEENFGKQKDILAMTIDQGATLGAYCWPAGFWADTNYMVDAPIVLNKANPNYHFDKTVSGFYYGMVKQFENEKTNHAYRLFGCDMAFVDAKINYKIMDKLIETWDSLGFNEDIEIRYSTPSRYLSAISKINKNEFKNETEVNFPVRHDDTFPYAQNPNQYWNGYYTSRPQLKSSIRKFGESLHSSLRLTSQQMLRRDRNESEIAEIL